MRCPSSRRLATLIVATAAVPITASSTALARRGPGSVSDGIETVVLSPWYVQSALAALLTLGIGSLLIATAPAGTRRRTDRVLEEPVYTFFYGCTLLTGVVGFSVLVLLTVTASFVVVLSLLCLLLAAVIVGELGYLAVGRLVADDWLPALGIAVAVSAAVGAVPALGTLVGFLISSLGIGTIVRGLLDPPDSAP